jgi:hypothetical protein
MDEQTPREQTPIAQPPVAATPDRAPAQEGAPPWRVGDTWTVRFRFEVASMVAVSDPPRAFEEREWVYTVDGRTADTVRISARPNEGEVWLFTFAPNGRLLSVCDTYGEESFASVADEPAIVLYGWGRRDTAIAWPRFPLDEPFGSDDSPLRQRSHSVDGDLDVALLRERRRGGSYVVETVMQHWNAGRPWWSRIHIEEQAVAGITSDKVTLDGELVSWSLGAP